MNSKLISTTKEQQADIMRAFNSLENAAMLFSPARALMAIAYQQVTKQGDGHPVLVIPGLGTDDTSMMAFKKMLEKSGFAPTGWNLGMNRGYSLEDEAHLVKMVREIKKATGQKVSIIGWSLGGMYARAIAQDSPSDVRQVITLGTPWKGIENTSIAHRFEKETGQQIQTTMTEQVVSRLKKISSDLEVPYMSIYSKEDGISYWEACRVELDHRQMAQSVEIGGQHFHLPNSLEAFSIVEDMLRMSAENWEPHPKADNNHSLVMRM